LRTLIARFGEDAPLTFAERADPVYGYREVVVNPADPAVAGLLTTNAITDPAATRMVVRMIAAQLAREPTRDLAWAVTQVTRLLRTQLATMPAGTTMEGAVLDIRTRGLEGRLASPALRAQADALVNEGILRSEEWMSGRTEDQFRGAVGEWLGREIVRAGAPAGGRTVRNVRFIGDLFADEAGTIPHEQSRGRPVVNTDVGEADFMVVTETAARFEAQSVANVKAARGLSGDAAVQNANALSLIRGHASGALAPIRVGGQVRWARVRSVQGVDVQSGAALDLSGRLTERSGGARGETIGPRTAPGYTRALPLTEAEITTLVRLLREAQMMRTPDY
jgi:hypothetical protein